MHVKTMTPQEMLDDAEDRYNQMWNRVKAQQQNTNALLETLGAHKSIVQTQTLMRFIQAYSQIHNIQQKGDAFIDETIDGELVSVRMDVSHFTTELYDLQHQIDDLNVKTSLAAAGALAGTAAINGLGGAAIVGGLIGGSAGVTIGSSLAAFIPFTAPAVLLGGLILSKVKKSEQMEKARASVAKVNHEIAQMELTLTFLEKLGELASLFDTFLMDFNQVFLELTTGLENILVSHMAIMDKKISTRFRLLLGLETRLDFRSLSIKEQKYLHLTMLSAQLMMKLIQIPLVSGKDQINENAGGQLESLNINTLQCMDSVMKL